MKMVAIYFIYKINKSASDYVIFVSWSYWNI